MVDTLSMSVVIDVIHEEAERLGSLISLYDDKIAGLPKGSISEKPRGNCMYCYLAYRKDGKVKFDYIGSKNSDKVRALRSQIEQRKKYEEKRYESIQNLKQIERLLNASK